MNRPCRRISLSLHPNKGLMNHISMHQAYCMYNHCEIDQTIDFSSSSKMINARYFFELEVDEIIQLIYSEKFLMMIMM